MDGGRAVSVMLVLRKLSSSFVHAQGALRSAIIRAIMYARFGNNVKIGRNVYFGKAVRLMATDGGVVVLSDGCAISDGAEIIAKSGRIEIGRHSYIGKGAVVVSRIRIEIGEKCKIAEYVTIRDQDHFVSRDTNLADGKFINRPITIGNSVWIGAKATVTKGVTVGHNSVIGAGAVVTRSVSGSTVVAGLPARVVKSIQ